MKAAGDAIAKLGESLNRLHRAQNHELDDDTGGDRFRVDECRSEREVSRESEGEERTSAEATAEEPTEGEPGAEMGNSGEAEEGTGNNAGAEEAQEE